MGLLPPEVFGTLARGGLLVDIDEHVATLTLNRPDTLNAQTPSMWEALAVVGEQLPVQVRAVVLRGAGRAFSAGINLAMATPEGVPGERSLADLLREDDAGIAEQVRRWQDGFSWLRRSDLITIAAVHGHAIGGGFQLALSCDVRIAADDASLCMKEPALGLVPDLTGTKALVELVGYSRALEICATARRIDATEALALGLVNRVVPPDGLDGAVAEAVRDLTANPHGAVTATKALLLGAAERPLDEQRRLEREEQVRRLRAVF